MSTEKLRHKKTFTVEEVSNHNSPGNIWVIVHDKVYDISKFVDDKGKAIFYFNRAHQTKHPGGVIPLFDVAGEDATEAFNNVGHSKDARTLMNRNYYIGDVSRDT